MKTKALHECSICGLKYKDGKLARKCEEWCSTHDSCNLRIGRQATKQ